MKTGQGVVLQETSTITLRKICILIEHSYTQSKTTIEYTPAKIPHNTFAYSRAPYHQQVQVAGYKTSFSHIVTFFIRCGTSNFKCYCLLKQVFPNTLTSGTIFLSIQHSILWYRYSCFLQFLMYNSSTKIKININYIHKMTVYLTLLLLYK